MFNFLERYSRAMKVGSIFIFLLCVEAKFLDKVFNEYSVIPQSELRA